MFVLQGNDQEEGKKINAVREGKLDGICSCVGEMARGLVIVSFLSYICHSMQ